MVSSYRLVWVIYRRNHNWSFFWWLNIFRNRKLQRENVKEILTFITTKNIWKNTKYGTTYCSQPKTSQISLKIFLPPPKYLWNIFHHLPNIFEIFFTTSQISLKYLSPPPRLRRESSIAGVASRCPVVACRLKVDCLVIKRLMIIVMMIMMLWSSW